MKLVSWDRARLGTLGSTRERVELLEDCPDSERDQPDDDVESRVVVSFWTMFDYTVTVRSQVWELTRSGWTFNDRLR